MSKTRTRSAFALVVVSFVIVAACGSMPPAPKSAAETKGVGDAGAREASSPVTATSPPFAVASLDDLAAKSGESAPSMREIARVEWPIPADAGDGVTFTPDRDTCYRASFSAAAKVRGAFFDAAHRPRGSAAEAAAGLVPPGGPVCTRKGEGITLAFERASPEIIVHAVVWASP